MNDIPSSLIAGDTSKFTIASSDYPVSAGWTLQFTLVGASSKLTVTATTDDVGYNVVLPAASTATLAAGTYSYAARVSLGDEVYTVASGLLSVTANLSTLATAILHSEQVITAIEELKLQMLADGAPVSATIAGRSFTFSTLAQLEQVRVNAYQELAALKRRYHGKSTIGTITLKVGNIR